MINIFVKSEKVRNEEWNVNKLLLVISCLEWSQSVKTNTFSTKPVNECMRTNLNTIQTIFFHLNSKNGIILI